MLEENPTPAEPGRVTPEYSYPGDLARFVRDRWRDVPEPLGNADPSPDAATLEGFFDACYQASMLREEERPVVFRATLAEPELFDPEGRPPEGLQRLAFPRPLPFDPREIRRLSVASDPQRALIGVRQDGEGDLRIWGLINPGTRWLRDIQGGRRAGVPLPSVPVVHVDASGSIEAYKGNELIGKLQGGKALGLENGPLPVGMAARSVLRVPGGTRPAPQGGPQPRARALGRGVGVAGARSPAQDRGAHDEARH